MVVVVVVKFVRSNAKDLQVLKPNTEPSLKRALEAYKTLFR